MVGQASGLGERSISLVFGREYKRGGIVSLQPGVKLLKVTSPGRSFLCVFLVGHSWVPNCTLRVLQAAVLDGLGRDAFCGKPESARKSAVFLLTIGGERVVGK